MTEFQLKPLHQEFMGYSRFTRQISPRTLRGYQNAFDLLLKRYPDITTAMLSPELLSGFFEWLQTRERTVGRGAIRQGVKKNSNRAAARPRSGPHFFQNHQTRVPALWARARPTLPRFAAGFFLATSRMPTLMSPHRPMSSSQSVQVTMLSSVEWAGTVILLLPHLRHLRGVLMSDWIGSVTVAPPFPIGNRDPLYARRNRNSTRSGDHLFIRRKPRSQRVRMSVTRPYQSAP